MANRDPDVPADAPPSYQQATGQSHSSEPTASSSHAANPSISVPATNGIPSSYRRSMEDEMRPLPKGWVRSFDAEAGHQFYVDTSKDPPRSIWVHPYDDEQYLSTLSAEDRERIEQESMGRGEPMSKEDIMAAHSDDEDHREGELPPRPDGKGKGRDDRSFGRKWKDKITGTTHQEREAERQRRAQQERELYEQHRRYRAAMAKAAQTGQPQLLGKGRDGKDVYVQPPAYPGGYGGGYGGGYDPYGRGGVYTSGNARYIRPADPYARPYGGGYGGGYGLPLAAGLGGGLLGGLLIGDAIGGFGF